jgi:competence protein ComEA
MILIILIHFLESKVFICKFVKQKFNRQPSPDMKSDFFFHNATERKATLALIILIILIWILTSIWPFILSQKKYDFKSFEQMNKDFETEMLLAESEAEETFTRKKYYPKKEYDEEEDNLKDTEYKKNRKESEIENNVLKPFEFDPNSADENTLKQLGLSQKTVKSILNFREKGGKFRTKNDFSRIYTIDSSAYQQLKSFIQLPDSIEKKKFQNFKSKEPLVEFEINQALAADFQKMPGIGPSFAERIIKYRNALGGFYKAEQVAEVFGLADSTFQKALPYLRCNPKSIKKVNINTVTAEELKTHPYLRWKHVNALIKYRKDNGPYKSVETLRTIMEFDDPEKTYKKIKPYLSIE